MFERITDFGKKLSRLIVVISALTIALRLGVKGLVSPEAIAIFLILVVFAATRESTIAKFIIAVFGLLFFLLDYVDYDFAKFKIAVVYSGALLIMLLGCFIMFGGIRNKR